jgi:pSer/pThr/pTyr-binding forkhead associated (FHA) protein
MFQAMPTHEARDLPAAAARSDPRLVRTLALVFPEAAPLRVWPAVEGERLVIGRAPPAGGLVVDAPGVEPSHCELRVEADRVRVRDLGTQQGTFLDRRRVVEATLSPGAVVRIGGALVVFGAHPRPALQLGAVAVLRSLPLCLALNLADRAASAPNDVTVLINGPSGAGKELIARRVHDATLRAGAFVAVNCGALPRDLIAAELFGHTRGAFSGAVSERRGFIRAAEGGTLLLDEVAELPVDLQGYLLRVLQERRVRPVGAEREMPVDLRIVAATHRPLEALVREGRFRRDLLARISGVTIELPGLADRREDILPLFCQFAGLCSGSEPALTVDGAEALLLHGWPGNVREVQHVAVRLQVFGDRLRRLDEQAVTLLLPRDRDGGPPGVAAPSPAAVELKALLDAHGGRVAEVARAIGRSRQSIYRVLAAEGWRPVRGLPATALENSEPERLDHP